MQQVDRCLLFCADYDGRRVRRDTTVDAFPRLRRNVCPTANASRPRPSNGRTACVCHEKVCQKSGLSDDRIWHIQKAFHRAPARHAHGRSGRNAAHPANGIWPDNYGRPLRLQTALQNPAMFLEIRAKGRRRAVAGDVRPALGRPGWDYVLIGRADATATLPFTTLETDLHQALALCHQREDRKSTKP